MNAEEVIENVLSISDVLKCPSPSQYFVGREDTLNRLYRIFSPQIVDPAQRIVALVASGGTGKTQTVLKFVLDNSSRLDNIQHFSRHDLIKYAQIFKHLVL